MKMQYESMKYLSWVFGLSALAIIVFLSVVTFNFFRIITFHDISLEPIRQPSSSRPPVYLISYADGPDVFLKNQNALALSALNKGIDFIYNYRRPHLDAEFVKRNEDVLNKPKGAGYWLWKPYLILKTLQSVPEGSLVVYADSGFIFRKSFEHILDQAMNHDMVLLHSDEPTMGVSANKVKRDVWAYLNIDDESHRQGPYIWAAFMVVRNTPASRVFIQQWLDLCQNPKLLIETPSDLPEHSEFQNHVHDQAILTALYNKHPEGKGLMSYVKESSWLVWHHRHPHMENESLLYYLGKKIHGIGRRIIQNERIAQLRQHWINSAN